MFEFLEQQKRGNPEKSIEVVNIVAHGSREDVYLSEDGSDGIDKESGFSRCAKDATIILDCCSTGEENNSIANKIAEKNSGKTVFAPRVNLYFSNPLFKKCYKKIVLDNITHGFAVFNNFSMGKFRCAKSF